MGRLCVMLGTDPLRAHVGRQVVAHLPDADLVGKLAVVSRRSVVLTEAVMLVSERGDTRKVPLDGEQHLSRAVGWLQVNP